MLDMTEAEWLNCSEPRSMLKFLIEKTSARKMQLFACACSRRIWRLLPNDRVRRKIARAEQLAEGLAEKPGGLILAGAAALTATDAVRIALDNADRDVDSEALPGLQVSVTRTAEDKKQAALLRHIIGNPFQQVMLPEQWPDNVIELAEAVYGGLDHAAALHAALEEVGLSEFAEHFQTPEHPKGCWVVDVILGKK